MQVNKLQPNKKSFEHYLRLGYESGTARMNSKQLRILKTISRIDDAVLIIDDILDESRERNRVKSLHTRRGIPFAIISAELMRGQAIQGLTQLMALSKTSQKNQIHVLKKVNDFFSAVYLAEKIDFELGLTAKYSSRLLKKYFRMIYLFTGGHIKYSLEIGQLLGNKKIDTALSKIASSLGAIRQICDDFKDYFHEHHEPFGDFLTGSNRLPELLFKKYKGDRDAVLKYLRQGLYKKARTIVLSSAVRRELYAYCERELSKCKKLKTNFDYYPLVEHFSDILTRTG